MQTDRSTQTLPPRAQAGGAPSRRRAGLLSPTATLVLLASLLISFLAGSSAPTPLYAVYQAEWGFTPITTTVVFGVYALAVLGALLTLGKLSDHVGRRPVLLVSTIAQVVSMAIFAVAGDVPVLILARVLQGLSTGAALGAIGAAMIDINRTRGTIANSVAPPIGTAIGALGSGLLVQFLPARTHLVYVVLLVVFIGQAIGVALMPETVTPKAGALASLRPEIALPRAVRGPVLIAAPVLVAVWGLAGLYGSLGPALVRHLVGSNALALGGLALFTIAASGALAVWLLRDIAPRTMMIIGVIGLLAGMAVTLGSINADSATEFFIGSVFAGIGFGSAFQGSIRTVVPLTEAHERAGVLSLLYVVSYLAFGVPAVIAGVLVVHAGGLLSTAREYGAAIMVLATLALVGLLRRPVAGQ